MGMKTSGLSVTIFEPTGNYVFQPPDTVIMEPFRLFILNKIILKYNNQCFFRYWVIGCYHPNTGMSSMVLINELRNTFSPSEC